MPPNALGFKFILDDSKNQEKLKSSFKSSLQKKQLRHSSKQDNKSMRYQVILSGKFNTSQQYKKLFPISLRCFFAQSNTICVQDKNRTEARADCQIYSRSHSFFLYEAAKVWGFSVGSFKQRILCYKYILSTS